MPKQLFMARFELMVARFDPPKIPKCLENGLSCDEKWVTNVSKVCFSKNCPIPLGVHKQVKWALFEPIASHFGHSKDTKYLENELVWDKNSAKTGSKMCFSKDTSGFFGVHKQVG